jgi:hypothetical protein
MPQPPANMEELHFKLRRKTKTPRLFEFYWMQVQMPMRRLDYNAE